MKMKHIYGAMLIGWLAVQYILNLQEDILGIASLLGALCLFIVKERYVDKPFPLIDFSYAKKYFTAVLILLVSSVFCVLNQYADYTFYLISAALFGYVTGQKDENEQRQIAVLDRERRLRYHLEQAQNELLHSRQEIEQLAEIRERNSIAGVIFQMEAAISNIFYSPN